jgi:DNA processing protein
MIYNLDFHIKQLDDMKKYPKQLYFKGDISLLKKPLISIVGSRSPNQYAKNLIGEISSKLANAGICIVSGGAIGIDTIAHNMAKSSNTIMVAGTGLDKRYPAINKNMIEDIEKNGLVLSQFEAGTSSFKYNFPLRNELVVALGEVLIVGYADINSGTMRSVNYALKMKKEIFVLSHRLNESNGTNKLLEDGAATAIFDIDKFVSRFSKIQNNDGAIDKFLQYCQNNPTYDEAINIYGAKVFEYELSGKIDIKNGNIYIK